MLEDPLIGTQLANFRIERALGRGGMAQVYYGYDIKLERPVAIKVIDARHRDNPVYARRFVREAQTIARWQHPHIIQIHYADDEDGLYYFVMEYIDGLDLGQLIAQYSDKGEWAPPAEVLRIGQAAASALDYAHRQGVIHRDVKPSNILIAKNGRITLADFGLALDVEQGTQGEVFGSAHYISPEQALNSAEAVPQSDLYSLGVILYELLTGQAPFNDLSSTSVAIQHITQPPPRPREINPELNEATEAVLLKALSKKAIDRYQTGLALIDALTRALQVSLAGSTAQVAASPVPTATTAQAAGAAPEAASTSATPARLADHRKFSYVGIGIGIAAVIILVVVAAGAFWLSNDGQEGVVNSVLPSSTSLTSPTPASEGQIQPAATLFESEPPPPTPTPTATSVPTPSAELTPTNTPVPAPTEPPAPPNTPTSLPPSPTSTPASTETPTLSPTSSPSPTVPPAPTATPTALPRSTPTPTVPATPTSTPTALPTSTSTLTPTPTLSPTPGPPQPIADSQTQFSGRQGGQNWHYQWSQGRESFNWVDMAYDGECWRVDPAQTNSVEGPVRICATAAHPGLTGDIAWRWTSQVNGLATVWVSARKIDTGGGDGVEIIVYRNLERLRSWQLAGTDGNGFSEQFQVELQAGDFLFFVVKIRGGPENDETALRAQIYR